MRIVSQFRPSADRPGAVNFLACNPARASSARGLGVGATIVAGLLISRPLAAAPLSGGDENGPKIQILAPRYQDVLKGRTRILIAITATQFNPESIELFVDDKSASNGPVKLSGFASSSFDWDTRQFSDGPHKLRVQVTDKNGFRSWASQTVFLNNKNAADNTPPSLDWKNLENYQELSGQTQIELKALDNFGVKYIIASISPLNDPSKKSLSWFQNQPPYVLKFDTTKVADGLYKVNAKAYDAKDQEGEAKTLTVGVVNNAINASSTSDYLAAMKRAEKVKADLDRGSAPTTKSKTNFVAEIPEMKADGKSGSVGTEDSVIKTPKVAKITKPGKITHAKIKQPAKTVGGPALPAIGEKKEPKIVAEVTKPNQEIGFPALLSSEASIESPKDQTIASAALSARATFASEKTEVKTLRVARLDVNAQKREVPTHGTLSTDNSVFGKQIALSLPAFQGAPRTAKTATSTPRTQFARLTAPVASARFVAIGTAAWSQSLKVESLALSGVRKLERAPLETEIKADLSAKLARPTLLTRVESASTAPRLSVIGALSRAILARRDRNAKIEVAGPKSARELKIAAPASAEVFAPVEVSAAQPALSNRKTAQSRIAPAQAARAGVQKAVGKIRDAGLSKTRVKKQIAALPRPEKSNNRNGRRAAITVSPIETSVQNAIPAFHRVERETTLRAIAARYGVPVELLAAANNWTSEMRVLRGMTVKMPRPLQVSYNGAPIQGETHTLLAGDISVTAFRALFEQAGGTLQWNALKQQVTARKGDSEIVVTIGSNQARVDNKKVMMNLAAFLFEGRTMIPVRFFEEGLKAEVEWDPQTGRLVVAMAG